MKAIVGATRLDKSYYDLFLSSLMDKIWSKIIPFAPNKTGERLPFRDGICAMSSDSFLASITSCYASIFFLAKSQIHLICSGNGMNIFIAIAPPLLTAKHRGTLS